MIPDGPPGPVHRPHPHDSALQHVTGAAAYIDDLPEPDNLLHAALVLSPLAHGRLLSVPRPAEGRLLTASDIPGLNDVSAIGLGGEVLLAEELVEYAGQPLALALAESLDAARALAGAVRPALEPLQPILTIAEAKRRGSFLRAPMVMERGDAATAMVTAPHRLRGRFSVGGQEHFYLESQIALAIPSGDGEFTIHASTQNPAEVQEVCARVLGLPMNAVTVTVRRMGGGFGGKETNATWVAALAALGAWATGRPVKLRLPREVDMVATGKRHGFDYAYEIGFDEEGRVLALEAELAANGGHSLDMTPGVLTRALCHLDNAYFIPAFRAVGLACKTNTVSNTAFRGFGGPQGVVLMEDAILRIAHRLGMTPEAVREANFYGGPGRDVTPYGQAVKDNAIQRCVGRAMEEAGWAARRAEIAAFNAGSRIIKRGLGLVPLKFGLGFNIAHFNQAGALVHVYSDGSIRLAHGGTEMGQGLFIKVAQVVASVFGVPLETVRPAATSTGEVPNTPATAASMGSDLNGWAAHDAASIVKGRMLAVAAAHLGLPAERLVVEDAVVRADDPASNATMSFAELAKLCVRQRVALSATGFYKVPDVHWDPARMQGSPYLYFTYGAAVAEVAVDTLTGALRVLRADIVQDCGRSLNPAIDRGQVEGAFVQGMGWFTCEELVWDEAGRLRTRGPSTYKIPGSRDVPAVLNVVIPDGMPNPAPTIFRSKGIGEPPLMLATAVWTATRDAIAAAVPGAPGPAMLDVPATPERVLAAINALRAAARTTEEV
jgi:xanthine dehydrogenase large subunit